MSKNKNSLEKMIMTAIVGAAVGSVIGMSVAPKKGKETRKNILTKVKNIIKILRS
jgi:gas vesicle protein